MTEERKVPSAVTIDWDLPLDQLVKTLVADVDHILPQDVTNEYIQQQYDRGFASKLRYDQGSQYGGYSTVGLRFCSQSELDDIAAEADKVLDHQSRK